MLITIDTSALLAVLVNEEHKKQIIEMTQGCDLQAPASLDAEIGNALSAMMKRNRISVKQASDVIRQFSRIPIRRTTIRLSEAVELANAFDLYAYDAYVLDSARQYQTPIISLDKKMVDVAKQLQIPVMEATL
ncbi:MAG: type II toxin-antitoxin system VapC family toxin [Balneolaceae bacterium]